MNTLTGLTLLMSGVYELMLLLFAIVIESPRANGARTVLRLILWPIVVTRFVRFVTSAIEACSPDSNYETIMIVPYIISAVALAMAFRELRSLHRHEQ